MNSGEFCRKYYACTEARDWIANEWLYDKPLSKAWTICKRPDWMLWVLGEAAGEEEFLDGETFKNILAVDTRIREVFDIDYEPYDEDDIEQGNIMPENFISHCGKLGNFVKADPAAAEELADWIRELFPKPLV